MVIETNDLNQIGLFFLAFLQFFLNDLFEAIDDELLNEAGRCLFCIYKLFICFGILFELLHVKEGERNVKFGAIGKLLDALLIHTF